MHKSPWNVDTGGIGLENVAYNKVGRNTQLRNTRGIESENVAYNKLGRNT